MAGQKQLFWASWDQPTEDYRPKTDPPHEAILGWWCTGWAEMGFTLVALIAAECQDVAEDALVDSWPELASLPEYRFVGPKENTELSDRYPMRDWIKERIDAYNAAIAKATAAK